MKNLKITFLIMISVLFSIVLIQCGESFSPTSNTDGVTQNKNSTSHDPLGRFCINNRFPLITHVGDVGYSCPVHGVDEAIDKSCGANMWSQYVTSPSGTLGSSGPHPNCEAMMPKVPYIFSVEPEGDNLEVWHIFVYSHKYRIQRRIEIGTSNTYGNWQTVVTKNNCAVTSYGCSGTTYNYVDTSIDIDDLVSGQSVQYRICSIVFTVSSSYSSTTALSTWTK